VLLYWCRKQLLFQLYLTKRNVSCIFHFPATRRLEKRIFDGHPCPYFSKMSVGFSRMTSREDHSIFTIFLGRPLTEKRGDTNGWCGLCHGRIEKSTMQFQKQFLFLVFRGSNFSTFICSHIFSCFQNTFSYHSYHKVCENCLLFSRPERFSYGKRTGEIG
jgi:hypothetical protein